MCCIFIYEKKLLLINDNWIEIFKMIYFVLMFNEEGDDWYISKIIVDKLNLIWYNINIVDLLLLVFVNCCVLFYFKFRNFIDDMVFYFLFFIVVFNFEIYYFFVY